MDQLAGLTAEARKLALDRFRLIQPHLEQNQSLQPLADEAGVPYRTAQRWVAQYRLFGLVALARKRREDRGGRRVVSAKLKEIIEGLALQKPPLPLAALFRQVQRLSQGPRREGSELWYRFQHRPQFGCRPRNPRPRRHEGVQQHI